MNTDPQPRRKRANYNCIKIQEKMSVSHASVFLSFLESKTFKAFLRKYEKINELKEEFEQ